MATEIKVMYEPELQEWHVVEWHGSVGTILFKAHTEDEAEDLAGTYAFIEQMELSSVLFCEWDK